MMAEEYTVLGPIIISIVGLTQMASGLFIHSKSHERKSTVNEQPFPKGSGFCLFNKQSF